MRLDMFTKQGVWQNAD